jgi:signal transduction histidine kinase
LETETFFQNVDTIKYLLLQLSIALDNKRIIQNLKEQENIAAIGSFASGIIHNLKNPIDGLRMIIEILRNDVEDNDPRKEYIDELYSGIIELKERLIHTFDFINHGDDMIEEVSVGSVIEKILENYDHSNYSPFELQIEEGEYIIKGDEEQLTFAFENIIQNAVEASDLTKPIRIILNRSSNKEMIVIRVLDEGKGIPDKDLDKIFNMFYSTRGKSRGLGLTLTRNIVKNHNGFINVVSQEHEGTEFKIVLPIA